MRCIRPDWPLPLSGRILALTTTREGGASRGPWAGFNLGDHVGDEPRAVAANRAELRAALPRGSQVQWLRQVHGTAVASATGEAVPEADACVSRCPGIACAVMTADCLPVLLADRAGTVVAAAHAGWRGLCDGVLEATIDAMGAAPAGLLAWLGPAIGPGSFEVGPEVRQAFLAKGAGERAFSAAGARPGHYLADLYALARQRLAARGVRQVYGGGLCTYRDRERFFSYRRDGQTGRMASLVMLVPRGEAT